eukprot:1152801-Pelagomonas_calceolata.AAC.1
MELCRCPSPCQHSHVPPPMTDEMDCRSSTCTRSQISRALNKPTTGQLLLLRLEPAKVHLGTWEGRGGEGEQTVGGWPKLVDGKGGKSVWSGYRVCRVYKICHKSNCMHISVQGVGNERPVNIRLSFELDVQAPEECNLYVMLAHVVALEAQSQHFRQAGTNLAHPRTSAWFMKSLREGKVYIAVPACGGSLAEAKRACNQTSPN